MKRVDLREFARAHQPGPTCSVCKLKGVREYISERWAEAQQKKIPLTATLMAALVRADLKYEVSADRVRRHIRRCQPEVHEYIRGG